jgi:small subunit ribosomal protein S20
LANIKSAKKRARQNPGLRQHNAGYRAMVRTYIKRVRVAIESGDKPKAEAAYREAVPVIDRVTRKHIMHANKAARHKSRLAQQIKTMG